MGLLNYGRSGWYVVAFCGILSLLMELAAANVVVIGNNVSLSFEDVGANFAPAIKGSGVCGTLYVAEPLDACAPLKNKTVEGPYAPFVLIIRGGCTFEDKVKSAQNAGFQAAIVYDNEDSGALVSMAGTPGGIHIHAVFVTKASGEVLKKYAGRTDVEVWIIPTFENSAWSIMAISFISLLAMSAVLATCFFVRRHRIRREQPQTRGSNVREFHGMSSRLVKAMPSLIFTSVLEDNSTSATCAICLEDYNVGDKLRILPCRHKFHAMCVDSWLTTWRSFCPVCKQDAGAGMANLPASERTPLLSSAPASPSSSSILSSFRSSVAASPAIRITPTPPRSQPASQTNSLSSTPMQIAPTLPRSPSSFRTHTLSGHPPISNPRRSFSRSPAIGISRSYIDLRHVSPHRSHVSQLLSPHSSGFPSSPINSQYASPHVSNSPLNPRYASPYVLSSGNASPSYLAGSSSRMSYLRHCSESGTSLSALASAQSLPGC